MKLSYIPQTSPNIPNIHCFFITGLLDQGKFQGPPIIGPIRIPWSGRFLGTGCHYWDLGSRSRNPWSKDNQTREPPPRPALFTFGPWSGRRFSVGFQMVWSLGSHRRSNWEKAFDYFTQVGHLHLQGKLRKPKCNIYAICFCLEHLINQEVAMLISWKAVNMESGMKMGSSFPSKNMVGRIIEIIDLSEKWVEMLHRPGLELIYKVKLCILSNLLMWNSFETSTWPRWEKNLNNQPKNG